MSDTLFLLAAGLLSLLAMAWLALSLPAHWKQVRPGTAGPDSGRLRLAGWLALLGSGVCCLQADHPSMAVLVWLMLLAAAAFSLGMLLSYRPTLLRILAIRPFSHA